MIDIEKYKMILDEGLLLDHYLLLVNIRDGQQQVKSKRITGFINLLCKKGYIEDGALTSKADALLVGEPLPKEPVEPQRIVQFVEVKKENAKFDFAGWVIQLHRKCEQKIVAATGKRQVRDKIDGKPYSFLPNPTDLGKTILRAIQTYKLKDFDKVEKTVLAYIDRCAKANKWFPILGYYIMKNHMSPMVTDMDSDDEEDNIKEDPTVNI